MQHLYIRISTCYNWCDVFLYSCISKPRNTTCVTYDAYLNYTNDVERLLQLEHEAMNYIEANVTNQYCRYYLKAALCATIYPPCDDGVQKLCSKECDSLLNKGACYYDKRYLIEHVANTVSNLFQNFTINCSNSLDFSSSFTSTKPCQSSKCISIIKISKTPPR